MSSTGQFFGGKPLRVTTLTTGSGTHTILSTSTYQRITLQDAGGGGGRPDAAGNYGAGGGGAGRWMQVITHLSGAQPYVVGAGGAGSTANDTGGADGSASRFGPIKGIGGAGGTASNYGADNNASQVTGSTNYSCIVGGGGGGGGNNAVGTAGSAVGTPTRDVANGIATGGAAGGGKGGGGGGGDSVLAPGGNGGASGAVGTAGTKGSGGGGGGGGSPTSNGGNGGDAVIIVEEF